MTEYKAPNVLRLSLESDPRSLHPGLSGDRRSQIVQVMLFDTLMRMGPEGTLENALAERVEVLDEGRRFVFHLRDAQWSNGLPIEAKDFVHAWQMVINPESDSAFGYAFYPIKNARLIKESRMPLDSMGVRAVDARTLEVELEYSAPYFLRLTANPIYAPICRAADLANKRWHLGEGSGFVCSGPFMLRRLRAGNSIHLERNPQYWDAASVQIDAIQISIIPEVLTSLASFEAGELDFCGEPLSELPLAALPSLQERGLASSLPMGGLYWYEFNTRIFPFNNKKFRQALAAALDRKAFVQHILHDSTEPAISIVPRSFDLAPERSLDQVQLAHGLLQDALAEMGITAEELPPIQLSYGMGERHRVFAQAVQQQWREVLGLPVSLDASDPSVFLDKLFSGQFQIAGSYWYSWFDDPIYNMQIYRQASDRMNSSGWQDENYTRLLALSDKEPDVEKRWNYLRQAEALIMEAVPVTPVFEVSYKYLQRPELQGVFISDLGQIDFRYAYYGSSSNSRTGMPADAPSSR
ncbi:MAG: peptide ABC transporter substrate-binding protein [Chlamydiia bacterium]|nr:peptide ABC transporter substrate-binding protein [Chlamydiia bacterium]